MGDRDTYNVWPKSSAFCLCSQTRDRVYIGRPWEGQRLAGYARFYEKASLYSVWNIGVPAPDIYWHTEYCNQTNGVQPKIRLGWARTEHTVLIGEEDMYLIVIFAIWPATLYYLLGQYYFIQEAKPRWLLEAMWPIEFPRLIWSDFEALLS